MVRISKMVKKEKKPTVVSDQEKWKLVVDAIAHIESKDIPSNFDEFKTMASTIWNKNFTRRITGKVLEKGTVLDVTEEMRAKEQQQKVNNQIDLSALDEPAPKSTSEVGGPFGPFARISKMEIRQKPDEEFKALRDWKLVFNFERGLEFNEIPVDQVQEVCRFLLNSDKAKEAEAKGEMIWLTIFYKSFYLNAKVYSVGSLYGIHIDDESKVCDGHALKIRHEKQPISSSEEEVDFEKFKQFTVEFRRLFDDLVEADVWRHKDKCKDKTCRCTRCNTEQYQRPKAYHDAKKKILTFISVYAGGAPGANRDWQRLQSLYMVFHMMWNHKNKTRIPLYTGLLVACGWKFEALGSVLSSGVKYLNSHSLFFKGDVDNKHGMDETTSTFTITKRKIKKCIVRLDGLRGVRRFKGRKVVNNWYKDNVNCNMNQVFYGLRSTWDNRDLSFQRQLDTYKKWFGSSPNPFNLTPIFSEGFKKYVMYTCRSGNGGGTHDDVRWAIGHCH